MERGEKYRIQDLEEPTNELEKYAHEVLEALIREGTPPTPSNFDAFFDKLLDEKPPAFRKKVHKLIELEEGDADHQKMIEHHIKEAFENIKKLLQRINLLYKNLRYLENTIEKRGLDTEGIADKTTMLYLAETIKKDIQTMLSTIRKEGDALKKSYQTTYDLIQELQQYAIYDDRFGVYKKEFLLRKLSQELKLTEELHSESTLMLVRAKDTILLPIKSHKIRHLVLRTIARLLLKTSRRSDIVSHYDSNIFAILMRHTNLDNAKKAAERLQDLVHNTNFFVGDEEIRLDVEIGIARIDSIRTIEQTIVCALDALDIANTSEDSYATCPQDIET